MAMVVVVLLLLHCIAWQVDVLVAYGLTYSFPLDEEEDGSRAPRPAPLAPAVDTLHTYCALPQPVARFLGDRRALKPGWARGSMPLMMRQMLAQRISTAVITRLEQVGLMLTPGSAGASQFWQLAALLRVGCFCVRACRPWVSAHNCAQLLYAMAVRAMDAPRVLSQHHTVC